MIKNYFRYYQVKKLLHLYRSYMKLALYSLIMSFCILGAYASFKTMHLFIATILVAILILYVDFTDNWLVRIARYIRTYRFGRKQKRKLNEGITSEAMPNEKEKTSTRERDETYR